MVKRFPTIIGKSFVSVPFQTFRFPFGIECVVHLCELSLYKSKSFIFGHFEGVYSFDLDSVGPVGVV